MIHHAYYIGKKDGWLLSLATKLTQKSIVRIDVLIKKRNILYSNYLPELLNLIQNLFNKNILLKQK